MKSRAHWLPARSRLIKACLAEGGRECPLDALLHAIDGLSEVMLHGEVEIDRRTRAHAVDQSHRISALEHELFEQLVIEEHRLNG